MIQRVTYRNMYVNKELKSLVHRKISAISKYNLGLTSIDIVIQKNNYSVNLGDKFDCHLSVDDDSGFFADINDRGDSPGRAIVLAFGRLRNALKRYHRNLYGRRRRTFKRPIKKSMLKSLIYGKEIDSSLNKGKLIDIF